MIENENEISEGEALIREKMRAGLSRSQAEEVIAAQAEHDANLAAAEKKAKKVKADQP